MNKSIDEYTIRCTATQTKKAFELGAPLFRYTSIPNFAEVIELSTSEYYEIPTAEQIELLKNNLRVCSYIENGSIHTTVTYDDILICHSEDGCV